VAVKGTRSYNIRPLTVSMCMFTSIFMLRVLDCVRSRFTVTWCATFLEGKGIISLSNIKFLPILFNTGPQTKQTGHYTVSPQALGFSDRHLWNTKNSHEKESWVQNLTKYNQTECNIYSASNPQNFCSHK